MKLAASLVCGLLVAGASAGNGEGCPGGGCDIFKKYDTVRQWPPGGKLAPGPVPIPVAPFVPSCSLFVCEKAKQCKTGVDCDCFNTGTRECMHAGEGHDCPWTRCVNSRNPLVQLQDDETKALGGALGPVAADSGVAGPSCTISLATEAQSPVWVDDHAAELKAAIQKDLAMSLAEPLATVVLESVTMPHNGPASVGALHVKFHSTAAVDESGREGCDKAKQVLRKGDLRFGATALLIGHTKGPVVPGVLHELLQEKALVKAQKKEEAKRPNARAKDLNGYWPTY